MSEIVKNIGIGYSSWDTSGERKEIGVGVFGSGFMGKAHTNAYKKISYLFPTNYIPRLVGISAFSLAEAKPAADRYGYEKYYTGWEEMLKNPDIQVFDNCAIDKLHVQPSIDAAKAGKHVLCEKPLAVGRINAKKMVEAVKATGVKNMVCFNYRFLPAIRLAWQLIKKGAIGNIYHFYGRYHQEYGLPEDTPIEKVWYLNMSGSAQGIATHLIDQSRFLVGDIATVMGDIRAYVKQRNSENGMVDVKLDDGMRALVEFKNGATGTYESLSVARGRNNQLYWEIYGSKGTLIFDLENPNYLKVFLKDNILPEVVGFTDVSVTQPDHPFMNVWWPKGHNIGWEHGHINLIAHFLDCVANNLDVNPLGATFEDGYKVAVILETIGESSKVGKKMDLVY